jgi:hypothetical protein
VWGVYWAATVAAVVFGVWVSTMPCTCMSGGLLCSFVAMVKYHNLSNFLPEDVTELDAAAAMSLAEQRGMKAILRSHFAYAKLAL